MKLRVEVLGLSALILYFTYHTFAGEQGLGKWSDVQSQLADRKAELARIETQISHLETDIQRLTPGTIDPDYIEALAREKLSFVYPDEIILLETVSSPANSQR